MLTPCLLHPSTPRLRSWLQNIHHPVIPSAHLLSANPVSHGLPLHQAFSLLMQKSLLWPPTTFKRHVNVLSVTYKVPCYLPRSSQPWIPVLLCCATLHKASCCLYPVPAAQNAVPLDVNEASSPVKLHLLRKALWPLYRTVFLLPLCRRSLAILVQD